MITASDLKGIMTMMIGNSKKIAAYFGRRCARNSRWGEAARKSA
jgi:hypothetical protein